MMAGVVLNFRDLFTPRGYYSFRGESERCANLIR
jgi:hypothetical protein